MFLDYFALLMLVLSVTALVYLFIYIHDLPYKTAKARQHPNQEAIHYACWLSLFTLHAIWPIIYIWAVMKKNPYPIEIVNRDATLGLNTEDGQNVTASIAALNLRIKTLEQQLANRGDNA
jgi:hypothetical protein